VQRLGTVQGPGSVKILCEQWGTSSAAPALAPTALAWKPFVNRDKKTLIWNIFYNNLNSCKRRENKRLKTLISTLNIFNHLINCFLPFVLLKEAEDHFRAASSVVGWLGSVFFFPEVGSGNAAVLAGRMGWDNITHPPVTEKGVKAKTTGCCCCW
jgi:hypothetical protein